MERISTLVIQKLLDAFFFGLDTVDEVRRRVDKLLGRPETDPFEVVWPEESAGKGNGEAAAHAAPVESTPAPEPEPAVEAEPVPAPKPAAAAKPKPKAAAPKAKPATKAKADKDGPTRPKVPLEIQDLSDKVKSNAFGIKALSENDEVASKRMLARVIFILGAAEEADLGALTSTEIAHVLTFGCDIVTFGTNVSRAIRQKTAGMVETRKGRKGETNRFSLTDDGRATFKKIYGKGA